MFALALIAALAVPQRPAPPAAGMQVDSRRHRISIVVGPFDVHAMPPGMAHAAHDEQPGTLALEFDWPAAGWFRGFRTEVLDARGAPLPHTLLHHFTLLNYDRRSLFTPVAERLAGASLESEDVIAPKSIGAPMKKGQRMGVSVMWRNQTGRNYTAVYVRLTLFWSPANLLPRPVSVLPIVLDANFRRGQPTTFDAPPGRHEVSREFVFPMSGRLVAVTGHVHDQGDSIRLEDAQTGRVLIQLRADRNPDGTVRGMTRRRLAWWGRGLKIEAGRRYRVIGVYNNVTADTARHAMAHLVGIFAPDDMRQWPPVDYDDPVYVADLARYRGGARPEQLVHQHTP